MLNPAVFESCLEKQQRIKRLFSDCDTPQKKYEKIIELGRLLPAYPIEFKTPDRLVKGCQSAMYLRTQLHEGKVHFQAFSEALISAGLAALLLAIYNDEPPEAVLACPPAIFDELGIYGSLSPSRSNGLSSLFQRMKQEALNFLIHSNFSKDN
jgi:cysteine desulfuration protein SufE